MAPKITPKVLLETSRFLKTIKNFRGTYEDLAARVAAGRAGVVNVGGSDAGEFFDTFMKALGLPLSVLSAGCARPAAGAPVTVVAYGSDVPLKSYVSEAVDKLAFKKLERSFYSFEFAAGDLGSYESGLAQYGSIEHLFIFAHGDYSKERVPYVGVKEKRFLFFKREKGISYAETLQFLSGIFASNVILASKPYLSANATVFIVACNMDFTWWENFRANTEVDIEVHHYNTKDYVFEGINWLFDKYGEEFIGVEELPKGIGEPRVP